MATKLILIRHGQTNWNFAKRYCGSADIGLNKKGRGQAEKLYKRLKVHNFHKVYASDRKRAIESAEIIFKGARVHKLRNLREIHFGVFEGLTHKEILKKYAKVYKKWVADPFGNTIPKGESLNDFKKRVIKAMRKIVKFNKNKTIAVVCHGGAISVFLNNILKSKNFWQQIPQTGSLNIIEYKNAKAKVRLFNDISHLSN